MPKLEKDYSGCSQVFDQNNDPPFFVADSPSAKHSAQENQPNSTQVNPSKLAQAYLSTCIPKNAKSASRSSFQIFRKFALTELEPNTNSAEYRALLAASERSDVICPGGKELEQATMRTIMNQCDPAQGFDDSDLK